jgi:thioredoxin 1
MNQTTLEITDKNFKGLLATNETVVVDFWAEWCGPCRALSPAIDQLSEAYQGRSIIGKLNVDENKETAIAYGITSIPTILFFKNGKLADRVKGAVAKTVLEAKLKDILINNE